MDISVVIPCCNEQENIVELVERLSRVMDGITTNHELVFVDDGSRDNTLAILRKLREKDHRIKIIVLTRNFGQQPAVNVGLDHAKGRIIVTMDADLENQPEDMPRLLAKLDEGHDVVRGARCSQKRALWRRLPSRIMVATVSWMIGRNYADFSSYMVLRRNIVKDLLKFNERSRCYTVLLNMVGGSTAEVEISCPSRHAGRSKYGFLKLVKMTLDLVTGYSRLPVHVVLGVGLVFVPLGVLFFALPAGLLGLSQAGKLLLGLGFFIGGLQLAAIGMVGEYVVRIYTETQARPDYFIKEILE